MCLAPYSSVFGQKRETEGPGDGTGRADGHQQTDSLQQEFSLFLGFWYLVV